MIQQMFKFEKSTISVINNSNDIWFRGKTVAKILGYSKTNTVKVINKYVKMNLVLFPTLGKRLK